jgi:predicted RNase H-like HicB family nuclease
LNDARALPTGFLSKPVVKRGAYTLARNFAEHVDMKLTAVFEKVPEGYISFVEELPGANCQASTLEEARADLAEAVELVLEANRFLSEESLHGRDVTREPMIVALT